MAAGGLGSFIVGPSEKKRPLVLDSVEAVVAATGRRVAARRDTCRDASGARIAAERITRDEAERNIYQSEEISAK
jgi:hypothetical protein